MAWAFSLFSREYPPRQAFAIIVLSSAVWGVLWVPMRHLEALGLEGLWAVVLFHILPAFAMAPFMRGLWRAAPRDRLPAIVAGLLMGAGFVLYSLGLIVASVTKTVMLFYMTPIWSTALAYFVLRERAGAARWLAIVAALAGCGLVTGITESALKFDPLDLLGLGSGLFWAMGSVVIRRYDRLDYIHVTFSQYLFGGVLALMAAAVVAAPIPALSVWAVAVVPAFVTSSVVFLPTALLIFRIMQYVSPGLVGVLMLSEAVVAALSAAFYLGEALTPPQWVGVSVILATGVFIGISEGGRRHAAPPPSHRN